MDRCRSMLCAAAFVLAVLLASGCEIKSSDLEELAFWKEPDPVQTQAGQLAAQEKAEVETQRRGAEGVSTSTLGQTGAVSVVATTRVTSKGAAAREVRDVAQFAGEGSHSGMSTLRTTQRVGLFGDLAEHQVATHEIADQNDNLRHITFTGEGADFDPQVDVTGQWLVFASTQHRQTSDLYIKRVGGTAVTQLTNDPGNDAMPVFSPDGKLLAFCSDRAGNWDIYLMDLAGGKPVQLSSDAAHEIHPSFSPDGRRLTYCAYNEQAGQWDLVVIDVDRPAAKKYIGHGLFPTWSPVGERILFQRARERGTRWFSIWTLDLADGEAVRPTEIVVSTNAATITPSWSPDGQFVVFSTVVDPDHQPADKPAEADVWVAAVEGQARVRLTTGQYMNTQPTWARDGTVYFVSNRATGSVDNVWSLKAQRVLETVTQANLGGSAPAMEMANSSGQGPVKAAKEGQASGKSGETAPEPANNSSALVPTN